MIAASSCHLTRTMNEQPPQHPPAMIAFMNQLVARLPEVAKVIHARRQEERGQILPYMEMGDLISWLGLMQARSRGSRAAGDRARVVVREFLEELENQFEVGNQDVDNLIAVGFLEGLRLTDDEFPSLRAMLPPRMSAWFALACE